MLILFQIIFSLFFLFALSSVVSRRRASMLGPKGFLFWMIFWFGAIIFVWWPNSTNVIAQTFGIGRGTDFVLYVSLTIIFFVLFRLHVKLESLSRDVTKLVRDRALEKTTDYRLQTTDNMQQTQQTTSDRSP